MTTCEIDLRVGGTWRYVMVTPDGLEVAALGEVEGVITSAARGDGGFGYDPVFVPLEGDGRTFAEMTDSEKHALSHRARAFRTLAKGVRVIQETEGR